MKIDIPCRHTQEIAALFSHVGAPVRFVGGCVRDTLAGSPVKDIDLATPALPQTVLETAERLGYRVIPTGLQHGTVTVVMDGEGYEITTLRADIETDGRHAKVAFVSDFETDAARRDFAFNAMSADLDGKVYDYFGGRSDLENRRVRFVGDMNERISEDYLRILRFFRFRARYGGSEPQGYVEAIGKHARGLERISGERIWSELSRILLADGAQSTVYDMERTGILGAAGLDLARLTRYAFPLGMNHKAVGRPAVLLGLVSRNKLSLEAACDRWRVSSSERAQAMLAIDVRDTMSAAGSSGFGSVYEPEFWIDRALEGESIEDVRATLYTLAMGELAEALPSELPVFPVRGQDLIDLGVKPGREMGALLRELKSTWMASKYAMTAEQLLSGDPVSVNVGGLKP